MQENSQIALAAPYVVHIGGGWGGVGSRITGSIPKKIGKRDLRKLRATLSRGATIEVVTASRVAWLAMAPNLLSQIGLRCVP